MLADQAVLELPGGAPKPPRPSRSDARVLAVAAAAFAETVCRSGKGYGKPGEFAEALLSCRAAGWDDGFEVARKLGAVGFHQDADLVDEMDGWQGAVTRAEDDAVKAWVAIWRPQCPFEGPARVVTGGGSRTRRGYAYRTLAYDAKALCVVVDDEAERPVNGGFIIPWEDVVEFADPTAVDLALEAERLAQEESWRRASVRSGYLREATGRRRDAVVAAKGGMVAADSRVVRETLERAAAEMLDGLRDGRDVETKACWATVVAAMDLLSRRSDEIDADCRQCLNLN